KSVMVRDTPTSSPSTRAVRTKSACCSMARMVSASPIGRRSPSVERTSTSMNSAAVNLGSSWYVTFMEAPLKMSLLQPFVYPALTKFPADKIGILFSTSGEWLQQWQASRWIFQEKQSHEESHHCLQGGIRQGNGRILERHLFRRLGLSLRPHS